MNIDVPQTALTITIQKITKIWGSHQIDHKSRRAEVFHERICDVENVEQSNILAFLVAHPVEGVRALESKSSYFDKRLERIMYYTREERMHSLSHVGGRHVLNRSPVRIKLNAYVSQ